MRMAVRLEVNGEPVRASFTEATDIAPRLVDHQVHIKRQRRRAPNGFDDHRPQRQVGHEHPIHHIHVDPVRAASLRPLDRLGQVPEVGIQNGRRDLDRHTGTACRSRRFFSARRSWPQAAWMSRPRLTRMVAATPA